MGHYVIGRRALLLSAVVGMAAASVSGCRGPQWHADAIAPEEHLLRGVIADKERLLARYRATMEAADTTELLSRLAANHERHVKTLTERLPPERPHTSDTTQEASPMPTPAPAPSAAVSLAALEVAEKTAAGRRSRQAARASAPSLAQLLVSISAGEFGHAHLLAQARETADG